MLPPLSLTQTSPWTWKTRRKRRKWWQRRRRTPTTTRTTPPPTPTPPQTTAAARRPPPRPPSKAATPIPARRQRCPSGRSEIRPHGRYPHASQVRNEIVILPHAAALSHLNHSLLSQVSALNSSAMTPSRPTGSRTASCLTSSTSSSGERSPCTTSPSTRTSSWMNPIRHPRRERPLFIYLFCLYLFISLGVRPLRHQLQRPSDNRGGRA